MKCKILMRTFVSFLLLAQQTHGFEMSFAEKTVNLRTAALMNEFLSGPTPLDLRKLHKDDAALFELLKKNPTDKLKVQYTENGIAAQFEKIAITVEIKGNQLFLGGVPHKINPQISVTENIRNWAKLYIQNDKSSKLWQLATPVANAADPVPLSKSPMTIATEDIRNFAKFMMDQQNLSGLASAQMTPAAIAGGVGAIGGGLLAGFAGLTITTFGAVLCEAMSEGDAKYFQTARSRERLNCYSAPLSFIGVNPRDQLFLQSIRCEENQITTNLESNRGMKATRVFKFDKTTLTTVEESRLLGRYSDKRETKSLKFSNPMKSAEVKVFENLKPEMNFYRSLCQNQDKLAEFRRQADSAQSQKQIHTQQAPAAKSLGTN